MAEIFTLPDIDEDPDGLAICMVRQDLEVSLLLDDGEQDYNILLANYPSKEPKDWNWNIYMQYIRNSSALDHVHVLFKEPEEINLEGLKELFEDSICNKVAVEVVDSDDMAVCAEELLCNGNIADSNEDIVIIPAIEDVRDHKWLLNLDCTAVNLLGKKLGADVKECEKPMNNYSDQMAFKRIHLENTNIYGQKYCRYWFDRGK